jgi:predicted permease
MRSAGSFWYRLLLLVYPRSFRRKWGADVVQFLVEQRRERRYDAGRYGKLLFLKDVMADGLASSWRLRFAAAAGEPRLPSARNANRHKTRHKTMVAERWFRVMRATVWQDVRHAVRELRRSPAFTALVILILSVNVAMFSTVNTVLMRSLPFAEPHRLVFGTRTTGDRTGGFVSAHDYSDYRDRATAFESLSALLLGPRSFTVVGGQEPERVSGTWISVDLFHTLGVEPQIGRHFTVEERELPAGGVVLISHSYWQRHFAGARDAVGRTLIVDGDPHTVVGVMPAGFHFLYEVDLWRPLKLGGPFADARRFTNWWVVGRLGPDVLIEQAQSQVDVISAQLAAEYPDTNRDRGLRLQGLHEALVEDYRASLYMLLAAVGLVLLIACGNVAGLLLARGSMRGTELSVRAALGASRARLVRQLLTENLVTGVAGGVLGTALAVWLGPLMLRLIPVDGSGVSEIGVSVPMLLFALTLSLATGLLFGIIPATRGARFDLVEGLKAGVRTTDSGGTRFRGALVTAQVALSVVLLIGSGLLIRSFTSLRSVDPGFSTENLLTAEIRLSGGEYDLQQRVLFYSELLESIRAIPGVMDATMANMLPIRDLGNDTHVWPVDNPPPSVADARTAYQRTVYPGYFEAMGTPLLLGRVLEPSDRADVPLVLMINETMAQQFFPGQNPIGRQVVFDAGESVTGEVVGVVADVRVSRLSQSPYQAFYRSYLQWPHATMRLAIRVDGEPTSVAPQVRQAVWNLDSDIPVTELATMEQLIAGSMSDRRVIALSLTLFASVALFLAAIGLYSVLAYYVSRRVHEIGVRVALGAGAAQLVRLVLRRGITLVATGIAVGLAGAFALTRLIQQMLFGVEPTDATTFVGVIVLFAMIALIACLIPAWRAVRVDPVAALQAE